MATSDAGAVWFSEADVRRQLQALGYADVPDDILADFMRDLVAMAASEEDHEAPLPLHAAPAAPSAWRDLHPRPAAAFDQSTASVASSSRSTRKASGTPTPRKRKTVRQGGQVEEHLYGVPREDEYMLGLFGQLEQFSLDSKENESAFLAAADWNGSAGYADDLDSLASDMSMMARGPHLGDRCCKTAPPSSVIYPRAEPRRRRADPVSRGAQYRAAWDSHKAPGEKSRQKLRWNVRQDLIERKEEPFQRPRHKKLEPNNYVVPTEKKRMPLRWKVRQHVNHMH